MGYDARVYIDIDSGPFLFLSWRHGNRNRDTPEIWRHENMDFDQQKMGGLLESNQPINNSNGV